MNKMNNALSKIAAKLRKNRPMANPSVCEYQPSVFSCNPVNEPPIGKNIPNTRLQLITRRVHGFTLIELVVTMVVATILVAVAVPNLRTFIQNGRLITQTNDLIGDLSYARNESLRRTSFNGQPINIGMCISTNGTTCTGGGQWSNGRLIFVDANNNRLWDAGELVLRYREQLSGNNTLANTAINDPLIFTRGTSTPNPGVAARSFTFCDDRGPANGKRIDMNFTGTAAVNSAPPASCI